MSAFGVKTPLCRAVVNKDFKYRSSNEICTVLKSQFQGDPQKLYSVIECEDIISLREEESNPIKIPGCVKNSYHMICFEPNGTIVTKVNLCSCAECLEGNVSDCSIEKGNMVCGDDDEKDTDSEVEYEDEDVLGDDIYDNDYERYELRSESVLEALTKESVIALFSPSNSLELFYLCHVLDFGVATEDLKDENNHRIGKDCPYILVNYYEMKANSEFSKQGHMVYRSTSTPVYVYPPQVMSPSVNVTFIGSNVHLACDEYQWLCDSI